MTMADPIADMLTRIRNATARCHPQVEIPASRLKTAIADVLAREGYIAGYEHRREGSKAKATLVLKLKYKGKRGKEAVITGLERVSRPSRRVYVSADEIPEVLGGLGILILSTSQGVLTGRQARAQRVGGELLCKVW